MKLLNARTIKNEEFKYDVIVGKIIWHQKSVEYATIANRFMKPFTLIQNISRVFFSKKNRNN